MYLEYALYNPSNRNKIIQKDKLYELAAKEGAKAPIFRSVYEYTDDVIEYVRTTKSIKSYTGIRAITEVPIDIDRGMNTDAYTLKKLHGILDKLVQLGIHTDSYQIYFSGTGYHVMLSSNLFGFKPSVDLPYIVQKTMESVGLSQDIAVYRGAQILRVEHTINEKSGLYKIPLTYEEARTLTHDEIHELAKTQRLDFMYDRLIGNMELEEYVFNDSNVPAPEKTLHKEGAYNSNRAICIQSIWSLGPEEGSRHDCILRLASHFKRSAIPLEAALYAIHGWNNGSLVEQAVDKIVSGVYNSSVRYGCNDRLLRFHCNPKCTYFNNRDDYGNKPQLKSMQDGLIALKDFVKTVATSEHEINLKDLFGLDVDCKLYPGELVSFIGDTGVNKTALVQNIILGVDAINDRVVPHSKSIIYYGPELTLAEIALRNFCILSGKSKKEIEESGGVIDQEYIDLANNIHVVDRALTMNQIEELVNMYNPQVLVIDYLKQIKAVEWSKSQYIAATNICITLSEWAVKHNMVIILIAQVNKDATKDGKKLTVHSGADTAAIEQTSRKLFSIDGKQDSIYRTLSMLKSNNSEPWKKSIALELQPSWRLLRRIALEK